MKTISAEDFLAEMANRNIGLDTDYEPPQQTLLYFQKYLHAASWPAGSTQLARMLSDLLTALVGGGGS